MARVLFLPDESSVIMLHVPLPADALVQQVKSGQWQPPAPYADWLTESSFSLNCAILGSLVIIKVEQDGPAPARPPELTTPRLSQREQQVLQYMVEGLKQAEIARRMGLSVRTVAAHINQIKARLGVRTVAQGVSRATALGLLRMRRRE